MGLVYTEMTRAGKEEEGRKSERERGMEADERASEQKGRYFNSENTTKQDGRKGKGRKNRGGKGLAAVLFGDGWAAVALGGATGRCITGTGTGTDWQLRRPHTHTLSTEAHHYTGAYCPLTHAHSLIPLASTAIAACLPACLLPSPHPLLTPPTDVNHGVHATCYLHSAY